MTFAVSAFVMGLLASGHCLGMCGPLVLALPHGNGSLGLAILYRLVYNLGRITTYAALGLIAGFAGKALVLQIAQAQLARLAGALLITVAVLQILPRFQIRLFSQWYGAFTRYLSPKIQHMGSGRFLLLGMLNGFLPCGMVAAALVVSVAAATPVEALGYMAIYGAGTLPMMLAASLMGLYLAARTRKILTLLGPAYGLALGLLLFLRPGLVAPHCG